MAGFTLPKLRWLVLGAAAAGLWAMTQDVPRQNEGPKQPRREATEKAPRQRVAEAPRAVRPKVRTESSESAAKVVTPQTIEPPAPRPSEMTTSSIPRPSKPVEPGAVTRKVFTTSRVRLRQKADLSGAVVTTLERGKAVGHLSRKGKWHLVSVGGMTGWVHGDFLADERPAAETAASPAPPRPKQLVTRAEPAQPALRPDKALQSAPVVPSVPIADNASWSSNWAGMRPVRAPQGGNCQCPYDLMLSGKACGDHSAYARRNAEAQCYF